MKLFNKTVAAAALIAAGTAAQAELSVEADIASTYLWRGIDLGQGSPAFSGGVGYGTGPFYFGAWGSSGDDAAGQEYDLYAGIGFDFGGLGVDLSYVGYKYPTFKSTTGASADFEEFILGLSYGDFGISFATDNYTDYLYTAATADVEDFSFTLGYWDIEPSAGGGSGWHLDATYNVGNLRFTLSQSMDNGTGALGEELIFLVGYSIPLDL